jgi:hypothetical protein
MACWSESTTVGNRLFPVVQGTCSKALLRITGGVYLFAVTDPSVFTMQHSS